MARVQNIISGDYHSLIAKTDGSLYDCGQNGYVELGDGKTNDQHSPVYIIAVTNMQSISGGAIP